MPLSVRPSQPYDSGLVDAAMKDLPDFAWFVPAYGFLARGVLHEEALYEAEPLPGESTRIVCNGVTCDKSPIIFHGPREAKSDNVFPCSASSHRRLFGFKSQWYWVVNPDSGG